MDVASASLLFAGVGLLYIALGIPLLRGQVKPNRWYGSRTRKTLSNEKTWYAVNRVTGRDLIATGSAVVIVAVIVFLFRNQISSTFAAAVLLYVLVVGVGVMVVDSLNAEEQM